MDNIKKTLWTLILIAATAAMTCNSMARESTLLNDGWRFLRGEQNGAERADFIETNWQPVSLPHNWGWEQGQSGQPYYRGPGWYRRDLVIQPNSSHRYYLRFEAAGSVADVYLNGRLLGQHRGAFGAFSFEITTNLSSTGTNLLVVRASNSAQPDVAPLSGDFNIYGGLYRSVHLIETETTSFAVTDHASPGVAWLETSVSADQAVLDVIPQISNGTRRQQAVTLAAKLVDAAGRVVASTNQEIRLVAGQTAPFPLRLIVPHPHLWNGRPDPYLYTAVVELRAGDAVRDSVEQTLGLRSYRVDPDNGFFLNGQPYHLHGVNRHQDRQDKGWAVSEADQDEDMQLIKELGCTVIRCAHYQHSDYFYSLCDKVGILVWAEIPQVDRIGTSAQFAETSRGQLLDLIRQNVNHPSIFAWSLFNELRDGSPDPHRLLQDLKVVANGEDPTRPTIAATCTGNLPQMNKIPDLLGWNIYPGWYPGWGPKEDFAKVDRYRYDSRSGGVCISEYGGGANPNQHEENPKAPQAGGQWHPEEWQASLHETAWADLKSKPFIWGTFVWCMFDFGVSTRNEGGVRGRNDKGLVTYDRKTKKDAYYFYKANWSDEPMIYIASWRFTERTNAVTDVKIYSNAKTAELLINGTSAGTRENDGNSVFVWRGVKLASGENQIKARAQSHGQTLSDECRWVLK